MSENRNFSLGERRDQVFARLVSAAGDWVCGPQLATATCGGSEGLRRLREIRAKGYPIEKQKHAKRDHYDYRFEKQ